MSSASGDGPTTQQQDPQAPGQRQQIGVVGGGQLAAMLVETDNNQIDYWVLDPDMQCPASTVGANVVKGHPTNADDVARLAEHASMVTLDLENVSVSGLETLQGLGVKVIPDPALLARITNKFHQKQMLVELGIPTAPFEAVDGTRPIPAPFGFPIVQKASTGGYDGRGVFVLKSDADQNDRLQVDGFVEQYIERRMELSVMVAASTSGEVKSYAPVEMVFRETGNVLDYLIAPARIEPDIAQRATELGLRTIAAMKSPGLYGIEMFLTPANELLVNEISPRAHNSGHYTMEACASSQFDQQRSILSGAPLTDTTQHTPAVMFNLLGEDGYTGATVVEKESHIDNNPNIFVHLYGKQQCNPGRKMGHVTVLADTVDQAIDNAMTARTQIRVRGENANG